MSEGERTTLPDKPAMTTENLCKRSSQIAEKIAAQQSVPDHER